MEDSLRIRPWAWQKEESKGCMKQFPLNSGLRNIQYNFATLLQKALYLQHLWWTSAEKRQISKSFRTYWVWEALFYAWFTALLPQYLWDLEQVFRKYIPLFSYMNSGTSFFYFSVLLLSIFLPGIAEVLFSKFYSGRLTFPFSVPLSYTIAALSLNTSFTLPQLYSS